MGALAFFMGSGIYINMHIYIYTHIHIYTYTMYIYIYACKKHVGFNEACGLGKKEHQMEKNMENDMHTVRI